MSKHRGVGKRGVENNIHVTVYMYLQIQFDALSAVRSGRGQDLANYQANCQCSIEANFE